MRRHELLTERETEAVCVHTEKLLREKRRHGRRWRDLSAEHGAALLTRVWRCRSRGTPMRVADLEILSAWLDVAQRRLLQPIGTRYRPGRTIAFHPEVELGEELAQSVVRRVEGQARWFEQRQDSWGYPAPRFFRTMERRPRRLADRATLAYGRAQAVRERCRLGAGPLPSVRWVIASLRISSVSLHEDSVAAAGAFGGLWRGYPFIAGTKSFQQMPGWQRRELLAEALFRLLLRDATKNDVARVAARAFLVPSPLGILRNEAETSVIVRQVIARAYGVSERLIRERLDDWHVLDGGRPGRNWADAPTKERWGAPPNPFEESDDFGIGG